MPVSVTNIAGGGGGGARLQGRRQNRLCRICRTIPSAAAADRAWIHPRDLALAEAGLLGDFAAAALPATAGGLAQGLGGAGRAAAILAAEAERLPDGATLAQGLALARALRRLASLSGGDPLAAPVGLLQPLLPADAPPQRLRPERLAAWQQAALGITPQGALQILNRMLMVGVVREATGRRSFRDYVIG